MDEGVPHVKLLQVALKYKQEIDHTIFTSHGQR